MIEGGWFYVYGAYGVTLAALLALVVVVALRARRWAKAARELDEKTP